MADYREGQRLLGSDGQIYVVRGGVPTLEAGSTDVSRIVAPSPVRVAKEAQDRARQAAADARAERADQRSAHADARAQAEFDAKNNPAPAPGDTTKTGDDYLATLSPALAAQVKALSEGRRAFPTGAALRSPQVQELVAAATQYDPTLDAANAATRVATRKDFTSGKAAQNITAMNTALGHLGSLSDAAAALENRSFPLWNRLANAGESATGDPRVKNFTLARDAVANELMKVFRGTGGSVSEIEEWKHNIDASDSPDQLHATITKATELLRSRLEAMNDQYGRGMGKSGDPIQLLSPHAQDIFNKITTAPGLGIGGDSGGSAGPDGSGPNGSGPTPPAGPTETVATGPTRTIYEPRMSSQVDALVNAGASKATIDAVLKKQNLPPIDAASFNAAKAWMKANPGKKYFGADINRTEDMSLLQRAAGSDAGAFIAQMANTATAGIPAALAGEKGQGALDAMAANSPNASIAGSLIGNVTGASGGEALVAARAPAALARFAPRITDAIFGGLQGFNAAQDGQGGTAALEGAGAGVLGGFLGDRAVRAAGAVTRGVTDPAVRYLRDRGIPLTAGQTVGDAGFLGRTVKGVEDALTSVPGVGNLIDARRREGLQAFNRAAFQDAAAPGAQITASGAEGLGQVRQSVQDAYGRALDPVNLDTTDPQFIADAAAAHAAAQSVPNVQPTMPSDYAQASLTNRLTPTDPTGQMTGRQFQEAYRGLARDGRARAESDFGHEIAGATRLGQDALGAALERQNPGAFDGFLEANAANRRMNVLAGALKNAGNQAEELITPAQLNRADIASTSRLEGQINSAAGNRPFYDLANAGQQVLPSKLPDSGTAKRAIVGALTTGTLGGTGYAAGGGEGAGYGTGGGLALSAALALGGTRAGQRALTTMIADRPELAVRFGELLMQQARIGGGIGAGIATTKATQR